VELGGALLGEPRREIARSDAAGACGDGAHRPYDAACEEDAEEEKQRRRHDERADADPDGACSVVGR